MTKDTALRNEFVGRAFGRLRVVDVLQNGGGTARLLQCVCTCGMLCAAAAHQLRSGDKRSCGCLKRSVLGDSTRTHGRANSWKTGYADRTYGIWQAMWDRCTNSNRKDWHCYGGKGVTVCERWSSFEAFVEDMGEAPAGLTLDRLENTAGYSKENCQWATRAEQSRNTSRVVWITHGGETHSVGDWIKIQNMPPTRYYKRVRLGWSREAALGLAKG